MYWIFLSNLKSSSVLLWEKLWNSIKNWRIFKLQTFYRVALSKSNIFPWMKLVNNISAKNKILISSLQWYLDSMSSVFVLWKKWGNREFKSVHIILVLCSSSTQHRSFRIFFLNLKRVMYTYNCLYLNRFRFPILFNI